MWSAKYPVEIFLKIATQTCSVTTGKSTWNFSGNFLEIFRKFSIFKKKTTGNFPVVTLHVWVMWLIGATRWSASFSTWFRRAKTTLQSLQRRSTHTPEKHTYTHTKTHTHTHTHRTTCVCARTRTYKYVYDTHTHTHTCCRVDSVHVGNCFVWICVM